jgi:hypothetical protein
MSTGNRCAIYDDIDALSEARSVADLVRRLQPILSELAYYGVTGETAVLEAHEEWRTQYTDRLRSESGPDAARPDAARPDAARPDTSHSSRPSGSHGAQAARSSRSSQAAPSAYSARPPRPSASDSRNYTPQIVNGAGVPRALLSIMSGTHPSLRGD